MRVHVLKTWPKFFRAVVDGTKKFEWRKNDRDYQVNDILILKEFDPESGYITGDICFRAITYVLKGPDLGVPEGYAVLSLFEVTEEIKDLALIKTVESR